MMILDVFINKILTNLKYWSNCESVLQRTLNLLSELSVGFSAMRKLLRLDNIQFMLINHTVSVYNVQEKVFFLVFFLIVFVICATG